MTMSDLSNLRGSLYGDAEAARTATRGAVPPPATPEEPEWDRLSHTLAGWGPGRGAAPAPSRSMSPAPPRISAT
ncbi:MAG: hypothetical protein ACRD0M_10720, partial [Acidimicrobiales bacterium]